MLFSISGGTRGRLGDCAGTDGDCLFEEFGSVRAEQGAWDMSSDSTAGEENQQGCWDYEYDTKEEEFAVQMADVRKKLELAVKQDEETKASMDDIQQTLDESDADCQRLKTRIRKLEELRDESLAQARRMRANMEEFQRKREASARNQKRMREELAELEHARDENLRERERRGEELARERAGKRRRGAGGAGGGADGEGGAGGEGEADGEGEVGDATAGAKAKADAKAEADRGEWARLDFGDGARVVLRTDANEGFCIGGARVQTDAVRRKYAGHFYAVDDARVRAYVSSEHCVITRLASGQVELADMSSNGTWINEGRTPVKDLPGCDGCAGKTARLVDGDVVKVYLRGETDTPASAFFTFVDLRCTSAS